MTIAFLCPGCGKQHNVGDEQAGKQARCQCGMVLLIPGAPPAAGPTPGGDPFLASELGPPAAPQMPMMFPGAQQPAGAAPLPGPVYPGPLEAATWGGPAPSTRAAKAETALRNLVAFVALGYAAYFAYHYGRMLFGGIQVWYMIVVALPLVVACIGLIGLGFALLMRVRGTGLWGVIAGLVVLGITSLDLVILFVHIVRGTRMIGDPLIGANVMGEAFVQFLFSALFRLAPPAFIVWWSHVLNWEPRW